MTQTCMFTHGICIKIFFFTFCFTTIPLVVPSTVENVRRAQKLWTKKLFRALPLPISDVFSTKSDLLLVDSTVFFNYLPLYWSPDRPESMLNYPFSYCSSIATATLPEPQFLLLLLLLPTSYCYCTVTYMLHAYKVTLYRNHQSPAKMRTSQLWTLRTLFWLGLDTQNFTKVLIHVYYIILYYIIYPKFAPILRSQKKSIFHVPVPGLPVLTAYGSPYTL